MTSLKLNSLIGGVYVTLWETLRIIENITDKGLYRCFVDQG
ncbi:hypothetical protein PSFL107428_17950 [Pseudoalteromonas maricaloris]|nr:hypothetical protein [Pseudoalteromonas flavipulchra NCIMB 2033 = ATCC BAA-314]